MHKSLFVRYMDPETHRRLVDMARVRNISYAELMRRLVILWDVADKDMLEAVDLAPVTLSA